jgi:two-component system response regulator FixJ
MSASPSVLHVPEPLVCVIDADASTRASVSALLHRLGAAVRAYGCAREFLGSLGETVPACLVAEATMPDMNGIELMQELRRRGLDIPTILLARHEDVPFAVAAMRAGAVDIVEKPYMDRALLHHVGLLLTPDNR